MKNTWKALIVILLSALGYRFLGDLIPKQYDKLLVLIKMILLLGIGFSLSPNMKKNNRWVGKVIISLVVFFIIGLRMDLFTFIEFNKGLQFLGLHGVFLDVILIYCGWVFYQI